MTVIPPNGTWIDQVIGFLKENSIAGGLFILLWKGMGYVAVHFSEKRKTEQRDVAKEEVEILRAEFKIKHDEHDKHLKELRDKLYK